MSGPQARDSGTLVAQSQVGATTSCSHRTVRTVAWLTANASPDAFGGSCQLWPLLPAPFRTRARGTPANTDRSPSPSCTGSGSRAYRGRVRPDPAPPARPVGFRVPPRRRVAERAFAWLGRNRRPSKDHEALPATEEARIYLGMVRLMAARLAR